MNVHEFKALDASNFCHTARHEIGALDAVEVLEARIPTLPLVAAMCAARLRSSRSKYARSSGQPVSF
jgi:hypothetical protein